MSEPAAAWLLIKRLTEPSRRAITQADGHPASITTPSLWDRATAAPTLSRSDPAPRHGNGQTGAGILDLELVDACITIRAYVRAQLHQRHLPATGSMPHRLRRLAAAILDTGDPTQIVALEDWLVAWADWLADRLHDERIPPTAVYLRNTRCPNCDTSHVVNEDDELTPALAVHLRAGIVQAAQCQACHHTWWRGRDLHELADLIAAATRRPLTEAGA